MADRRLAGHDESLEKREVVGLKVDRNACRVAWCSRGESHPRKLSRI